jgi:hypothetical protein
MQNIYTDAGNARLESGAGESGNIYSIIAQSSSEGDTSVVASPDDHLVPCCQPFPIALFAADPLALSWALAPGREIRLGHGEGGHAGRDTLRSPSWAVA